MQCHLLLSMPDGSEMGLWIPKGESMEECVNRFMENYRKMKENSKKTLTFEEFKTKLRENLISVSSEKRADEVLKAYDDELRNYYDAGWTIEGLTPALLMGM